MTNQIKFNKNYMSLQSKLPKELREQQEIYAFKQRFLISSGRRNDIRQLNKSIWENNNDKSNKI